jgi:protein-tyrosine phosphatase
MIKLDCFCPLCNQASLMSAESKSGSSTFRVLFVCLGNICRSPLAEGVFLEYARTDSTLKDAGFTNVEADSCGTAGYHSGEAPDSRSQAVARKHGFNIGSHQARRLSDDDFSSFNMIVCMDDSNYSETKRRSQRSGVTSTASIHKFLEFLPEANKKFGEIPDPYYGDKEDFEQVYQLLQSGMPQMVSNIVSNHSSKM